MTLDWSILLLVAVALVAGVGIGLEIARRRTQALKQRIILTIFGADSPIGGTLYNKEGRPRVRVSFHKDGVRLKLLDANRNVIW